MISTASIRKIGKGISEGTRVTILFDVSFVL